MDGQKPFSFRDRLGAFSHAFRGLIDIMRTEHNAWIHAVVTVIVLIICWWVHLETIKFCLIILAIVSVWVAEAVNTASEIAVDLSTPEHSPSAKRAKDISAAAVLIAAIGACALGLIILGPAVANRLAGA